MIGLAIGLAQLGRQLERGAPRLVTSETVPGGRFRHELHLKKEALGDASFIALGFDRPGLVLDTLELVEDGTRPPLVVIGLDGLTWRILDPLFQAGKLPHFKQLIDGGVSGVLLSEKPMLSPVVWTTIATGQKREDHGIGGFVVYKDPRKPKRGTLVGTEDRTRGDAEKERVADLSGSAGDGDGNGIFHGKGC